MNTELRPYPWEQSFKEEVEGTYNAPLLNTFMFWIRTSPPDADPDDRSPIEIEIMRREILRRMDDGWELHM